MKSGVSLVQSHLFTKNVQSPVSMCHGVWYGLQLSESISSQKTWQTPQTGGTFYN